jgi:tRNA-splicing ligase RtcB
MVVKEVNEADFEAEVLGSKIPVLVDVWATWCVAPGSTVLRNKYERLSAAEVGGNGTVLAYGDGTMKRGKVLESKTSSIMGHCKRISTVLGRHIETTDDHLFYTSAGWKRADHINKKDKVAVYPLFGAGVDVKENKPVSLLKETGLERFTDKKTILKKGIASLRERGLLPLKSDNPKIGTIARVVGMLFSDGSLYRHTSNNYSCAEFFLGSDEDARDLVQELGELGFAGNVKSRTNKFKIGGRDIEIKTKRVRVASTAFWLFVRALGVPSGRKTDIKYEVPRWIYKVSSDIRKEFLSGYLGGDGPSLSMRVIDRGKRGSYNSLSINDIEFYKNVDLEASGLRLAKQISKLLKEQGVGIRSIFLDKEKYTRSDNSQSTSVHIALSNTFDSGYALASIGYAYCTQKQEKACHIMEFLGKKLSERKVWADKYTRAVTMRNKGAARMEIASSLHISPSTVDGWLKHGNAPTINYTFDRYSDWIKGATKGLSGGLVWDEVNKVEEVHLPKVQAITIDKYSNFIANGFLVHNCGPCRMYGPIIEEVSRDYEGKVKFVKVDADQNEGIARKYNVMSIPTTLLIVKGQTKAMSVGAVPKETLKKWIEKNL